MHICTSVSRSPSWDLRLTGSRVVLPAPKVRPAQSRSTIQVATMILASPSPRIHLNRAGPWPALAHPQGSRARLASAGRKPLPARRKVLVRTSEHWVRIGVGSWAGRGGRMDPQCRSAQHGRAEHAIASLPTVLPHCTCAADGHAAAQCDALVAGLRPCLRAHMPVPRSTCTPTMPCTHACLHTRTHARSGRTRRSLMEWRVRGPAC